MWKIVQSSKFWQENGRSVVCNAFLNTLTTGTRFPRGSPRNDSRPVSSMLKMSSELYTTRHAAMLARREIQSINRILLSNSGCLFCCNFECNLVTFLKMSLLRSPRSRWNISSRKSLSIRPDFRQLSPTLDH